MLVSNSQPEFVWRNKNINSYDKDIEDDSNQNDFGNNNSGQSTIQSIIKFVTGALLTDWGVE